MSQPRIVDVMAHPVRLRILHQLADRERTTVQLREALPDVTPATLYRHVGALLDAEVLTVVAERRVRGAVERTLALGPRTPHGGPEEVTAVGTAGVRQIYLVFLAQLSAQLDQFLDTADSELLALSGAAQTVLYVDQGDLAEIQQGLVELLADYREPKSGKRRVSLSTVLVPDTT